MSQIVIPFDQNPDSVAVKTGAYTIPAGKYARVVVTDMTGDFTIDGAVAVDQQVYTGSATTNPGGIKFTNTSGTSLRGVISQTNGAVIDIDESSTGFAYYTLNTAGVKEVVIHHGDTINVTGVTNGTMYWSLSTMDRSSVNVEFWVPAGTDLNGSRYTVELYNEVS